MKGAILNVNNILVDVDQLQFAAWRDLAMYEYGMGLPGKMAAGLKGQSRDQVLDAVLDHFKQMATPAERQEILDEQDKFYEKTLTTVDETKLLPNAQQLVISLYDHYVKVGVRDTDGHAADLVKQLKLDGYVDLVGPEADTGENPYTALVDQLEVPAAGSIAVATGAADLQQAAIAGLTTIGVGDAQELHGADYQVSLVGDLRYQMLEKVWEDKQ
ncbi:phosphatase [Limosilactobacillus kribbianus]|uniref:phosphatase n=1 Tax=Limosilactobacillus kribbianus TaxID=2982695 RepID=UPI002264D550|nr:phosphatase [Limosilactobacillus kribbianus]